MNTVFKCKVCGSEARDKSIKAREMMFGTREEFEYLKCSHCECLQLNAFPEDLQKYYPKGYYSLEETTLCRKTPVRRYLGELKDKYMFFSKGVLGRVLHKVFRKTRMYLFIDLGLQRDSRILDVGCGQGGLLKDFRRLGFTRLEGVDPFLASDVHEPNLDIFKKSIFDIKGEYDIIIFYHSLEHLSEPDKALCAAREILAPSGVCMVGVPLSDSWACEHYGENWVQIDAPRHFFIYSKKGMEILAQKAGFMVDKVVYDSTELQFLGSEQYVKGIPLKGENSYYVNPAKSVFSKKAVKGFAKKAERLNRDRAGDQAVFYLKRVI